jgi:hypothetical protein
MLTDLPVARPSQIPLPAPLCSTPVTALPRSYGRSDSCAGGSSAPRSMNTVLTRAGLPASCATPLSPFRLHPPSVSRRPFRTLPLRDDSLLRCHRLRFRRSHAGSSITSGRIEFVPYGLVTHLRLLPTSSRDDAVTVGYRPESVCLERTCTSLSWHHCRRT